MLFRSRVVVVTVCAGDPPPGPLAEFAQELHARWTESGPARPLPAQVTAARRAEDLAALDRLGAEAVHFSVPDAIYRTDPGTGRHLYAAERAILGQLHPAETVLVRRTAQRLSDLLRGMPRHRLYAPLTVGHHVDHLLTRQVAEAAGGIHAYYEDYPYTAREERARWLGSTITRTPLGREMVSEAVLLGEEQLRAKVHAIAAYISQISSFWADETAMETAVREFAGRSSGGETLWRAA